MILQEKNGVGFLKKTQTPIIFSMLTLSLFNNFNMKSNHLILETRDTTEKQYLKYWLRLLKIISGLDYYLKPIKGNKSYELLCSSDSNYFQQLWEKIITVPLRMD